MIITEIQYFFSKIIRFQAIFKDTVEFTCALEFKISSQLCSYFLCLSFSGGYLPAFCLRFTFLLMSGITLILCTMTSHMTIQSEMIAEREKRLAEAEMEKMRANLLRAISHDLRTPLTGIIGNSSLFLESQNDLSSTEQRTIMTNIYEDSNWLLNMVENLLSVTRIQGDSLSINTTEEPVEEVVGEALEKLKKRYPDAAIRVKIPEEFLMIPMDAVLIEQVTINLLENAIVHSGSILPIDFIVEDHPEHVSLL